MSALNSGPAVFTLEGRGASLYRQASGDLRHRRQQRQPALAVGHGLVGDAAGATFYQVLGLRRVGGQVQVGEQHVVFAQHRALDGLRLLDLDDHLGRVEHFLGRRQDRGADLLVAFVADADAGARGTLYVHVVSVQREFTHRRGRQADAVFVVLDFLGYPDFHLVSPA